MIVDPRPDPTTALGLIARRDAVLGVAAAVGLASAGQAARPAAFADRIAVIERRVGGRLGVALLDSATGRVVGHRSGERFPMCSTFKLLAAALTLVRVDRGQERLDRRVVFSSKDLVANSPVTERRTGNNGMTVAELCEAALTQSDNTAGNLLLAAFGGPPALTAFARTLGDRVTRLDRIETALNEAVAGDLRDTTSPAAMVGDLRRIVTDVLRPASRDLLLGWLVANHTGDARLRAGLPPTWRVGDKTGAGENGTTNDVAILWPPGRGPVLVAAYLTASPAPVSARNAALADVAQAVAAEIGAA